MHVVSARFDDSWQLALEIERVHSSTVPLFLTGIPDPWSGSVCALTEDRVTPLDLTVNSAVDLMKFGDGVAEALRDPRHFKSGVGLSDSYAAFGLIRPPIAWRRRR
jgi:hypothetical protein